MEGVDWTKTETSRMDGRKRFERLFWICIDIISNQMEKKELNEILPFLTWETLDQIKSGITAGEASLECKDKR